MSEADKAFDEIWDKLGWQFDDFPGDCKDSVKAFYLAAFSLAQKSTRLEALEEAAQTADFVVGTAQEAAATIRQRVEDIP